MKKLKSYLILSFISCYPFFNRPYQEAKQTATVYLHQLHYSKKKTYDLMTAPEIHNYSNQVTSNTLTFTPTDFKENARKQAQHYADDLFYSKERIYKKLTHAKKDRFTKEEAQYALENIQVDYKENAIHLVYFYLDQGHLLEEIKVLLQNEEFTKEEINYAFNNY